MADKSALCLAGDLVIFGLSLQKMVRSLSGVFVRWILIGGSVFVFSIPLLYLFRDVLLLPLTVATLIVGEITLLTRFLGNERLVFTEALFAWHRLWRFHVASAASFVVWWSITNLIGALGVHYVLASAAAVCTSLCMNIATNFFWVWRASVLRRATARSTSGDVPA